MGIIVNVLGDFEVQSGTMSDITADGILCVWDKFTNENHIVPEKIIITIPDSGKIIEINIESMLQSELEKQLQGIKL